MFPALFLCLVVYFSSLLPFPSHVTLSTTVCYFIFCSCFWFTTYPPWRVRVLLDGYLNHNSHFQLQFALIGFIHGKCYSQSGPRKTGFRLGVSKRYPPSTLPPSLGELLFSPPQRNVNIYSSRALFDFISPVLYLFNPFNFYFLVVFNRFAFFLLTSFFQKFLQF